MNRLLTAYTFDKIQTALRDLPNWVILDELETYIIKRHIETETYAQGLALVQQIGELAEKQNHHPDLTLLYDEVMIEIHTHTCKGITHKDIEFAHAIEKILQ